MFFFSSFLLFLLKTLLLKLMLAVVFSWSGERDEGEMVQQTGRYQHLVTMLCKYKYKYKYKYKQTQTNTQTQREKDDEGMDQQRCQHLLTKSFSPFARCMVSSFPLLNLNLLLKEYRRYIVMGDSFYMGGKYGRELLYGRNIWERVREDIKAVIA